MTVRRILASDLEGLKRFEEEQRANEVKKVTKKPKVPEKKATVSEAQVQAQIDEAGSMKRTVDMSEVRRNIEQWVKGATKEVTSLEDKKAIRRVPRGKVEEEKRRNPGMKVYPAKLVCTEALAEVKELTEEEIEVIKREIQRKVRVVACGNFAIVGEEQTFSATPDITCLRIILRLACFAKREGLQVQVSATDVSVAFLNAPLQAEYKIAINPPALLQKMGLTEPGELWVLEKALYGLRESPRAWSMERDKILSTLTFEWEGGVAWLEQCGSEPGVWRIKSGTMNERLKFWRGEIQEKFFENEEGEGEFQEPRSWAEKLEEMLKQRNEKVVIGALMGWLLAYVDDLLIVSWMNEEAEKFPGELLQEEVEKHWKCGKSQKLSEDTPVEYTGIEIRELGESFHVAQMKYTKALLAKNNMLNNIRSDVIFDVNECEEESAMERRQEEKREMEKLKNKFQEKGVEQTNEENENNDCDDDEGDEWMSDERYAGLNQMEKLVKPRAGAAWSTHLAVKNPH